MEHLGDYPNAAYRHTSSVASRIGSLLGSPAGPSETDPNELEPAGDTSTTDEGADDE